MPDRDTTSPEAASGATPPEPPALEADATPGGGSAKGQDSLKETFESIVIAFILAFVFRAYIVEAFVIPTGSMAPTLLGAHLELRSPHTGYRFDTGKPYGRYNGQRVAVGQAPPGTRAVDPMTVTRHDVPTAARARPGDRILVHKYIYFLSEPRRWDVVVFKNPGTPGENYIKRLVGLPHEDLYLLDGNLYVQPRGEPWRIARKTDRPDVQRTVWQPVYHSAYVPLPSLSSPIGREAWAVPWRADDAAARDWDLTGRDAYRYTGGGPGRIAFDFDAGPYQAAEAMYPYNQFNLARVQLHPIEDVRLAATVELDDDADPVGLTLETTGRWDASSPAHPTQTLRARIDDRGVARLEVLDHPDAEPRTLAEASIDPVTPDKARRFELWYVDQHLLLYDGQRRILEATLDLTLAQLKSRPAPAMLPEPAIEVTGPATLRAVHLDRDLYYLAKPPPTGGHEARGGLPRSSDGTIDDGEPVRLGADEFFTLGDNSPESADGRYWQEHDLNPWVAAEYFRDPARARAGVVPRELLIGRAFFVYFPAPHALSHDRTGFIPNFGRMRFIH